MAMPLGGSSRPLSASSRVRSRSSMPTSYSRRHRLQFPCRLPVEYILTIWTSAMELLIIEAAARYFFSLHCLVWFCALVVLVSSIDDLFVDVSYWMICLGRWLGLLRKPPLSSVAALTDRIQRPIAIMAPAWKESEVIAHMVENAVATYDYEVFHIFIGVYPNDP